MTEYLDELFPDGEQDNCLIKLASAVTKPFDQKAFDLALDEIKKDIDSPLPIIQDQVTETVAGLSTMLGLYIYLPVLIVVLLVVWLLVPLGLLTWLWALVISVVFVLILYFFSVMFRASASQYTTSRLQDLDHTVKDYLNQTLSSAPSAIQKAACVYVNNIKFE